MCSGDLKQFSFEDFKASDLTAASNLHWADFEDALQSVTAERIAADAIITRTVKDFKDSRIMASTPSDFLKRQRRTESSKQTCPAHPVTF